VVLADFAYLLNKGYLNVTIIHSQHAFLYFEILASLVRLLLNLFDDSLTDWKWFCDC